MTSRRAVRRLAAALIATAALPCCTIAADVDIAVDVNVDDDASPSASTGESPASSDSEEPPDSTSGDETSTGDTSTSDTPPECGNGVVEDGEECDADAGDACELADLGCKWKRWLFLSSERRDGWAWRADLEGADEACRSEAAAAGLPVADSYRAFVPQGGIGPYDAWQWTTHRYRNACSGELVPGTDDPYSDPFNLLEQLHLGAVEVEDWPTCNAAGEPGPAPDLQFDKDPAPTYLAAWWTFTDTGRVLVPDSGGCKPGDAMGVVGFVGGGDKWHPHDGAVAGLERPCGIELPVLCVAAVPT